MGTRLWVNVEGGSFVCILNYCITKTNVMKLIIFLVFFSAQTLVSAQSKCNMDCNLQTGTEVRLADLNKYKGNYETIFRQGITNGTKTHSVSVDFSARAIQMFYSENFLFRSDLDGFNVYFICPKNSSLPGYAHTDQFGLMMFPADLNCKTDSSSGAFGVYNNSFNRKRLGYIPTTKVNQCSSSEFTTFKSAFWGKYNPASDKRYTSYVHFDKLVLQYLILFLNQSPDFTGVRFDIGSYNLPNMACGQDHDQQLTVFITPVKKNGVADYPAFLKFVNNTAPEFLKLRILSTFNHGELCPKNCPPEGN